MKTYWSERAKRITPYVAGEQPKMQNIIKLNTNENPFPPSPKAIDVIKQFDCDRLRLYPNPASQVLRSAAARRHGVAEENIFCGNGSDEVLAIAFQAFFDGGLAVADVSYSFYPVWADMYGISTEVIPLSEDYTVPVDKFCGKKCAVIPNPNAPTAIALSPEEIEQIVASAEGVVVIDEAYVEFGAQSVIPLTQKYSNLLVVRTFSKSHGLAGMRVGYAVGHKDLITAMDCIRDSFNSYPLDAIAQEAAAAALADEAYTAGVLKEIMTTRAFTAAELEKRGFAVLPSSANFVFAKPAGMEAQKVQAALKERGIFVRWFSGARVRDYLRITIGRRDQMEQLLSALDEILAK
ncbi:MAG: histidinol-phosphate transaminase [Christensenellaceae bacterium]|nr:histidinol-phosphate transaminase [Christensenellaceae bacterium]